MKPPDVTPTQYAALAVLLDGQVHRNMNIAKAIGHHRPESFTLILRSLEKRGLVERVKYATAGPAPGPRNGCGYRLTALGRRAWTETLDHYLFYARRFAGKAAPRTEGISSPEAIEPAPFAPLPFESDRSANETELAAIAAAASAELSILLRARTCGPLAFGELIALEIADVDVAAATVRAKAASRQKRAVAIGPALLTLIVEAAGGRQAGTVFVNRDGKPWTREAATRGFAAARKAAGVDRRVKLLGRSRRDRRDV